MSSEETTREDANRARLTDVKLEATIIGSCLLRPELIAGAEIETSDFFAEPHRLLWSALVGLAADGEPIDSVTLRSRLLDHGQLERVGGDQYLGDLLDKTIPVPPLPTGRLRRLAAERRLQAAALALAQKLGTSEYARELGYVERAQEALRSVERGGRVEVPELAALVEGLVFDGRRLPTGIATLDTATRGGVPRGSFVVLAGAPGAAKTTISVWLADSWERRGAEVMYLAADESLASILVRLGQLDGVPREAMESPMPAARAAFADRLRRTGRRLHVIDPLEHGLTLEAAAQYLESIAGDRVRVLVVDSLQEVPCAGAADALLDLDKANAVVAACKHIARRGTIVVGISEMSRAGYRGQGADTSTLSASKGSGKIEYGAALVCGLRPVRDSAGAVDLDIAKNRLGNDKPACRVQLDFGRASVSEVDAPDPDQERDRRTASATSRLRERILATLRVHTDLRTVTAVARFAGGRKTETIAMVRELVDEGAVVVVDKVYRVGGVPC